MPFSSPCRYFRSRKRQIWTLLKNCQASSFPPRIKKLPKPIWATVCVRGRICQNVLCKESSQFSVAKLIKARILNFFLIFSNFSIKSENPMKGSKLREFQKVAQNDHSWSALDYSRKTQTYLVLSRKVQQCPLERMGVFDEVRLSRFPSG